MSTLSGRVKEFESHGLADDTIERDILKKAIAIFSKPKKASKKRFERTFLDAVNFLCASLSFQILFFHLIYDEAAGIFVLPNVEKFEYT